MKYQSLFSGKKNKENIKLSSVEYAQRVVKVKAKPIALFSEKSKTYITLLSSVSNKLSHNMRHVPYHVFTQ